MNQSTNTKPNTRTSHPSKSTRTKQSRTSKSTCTQKSVTKASLAIPPRTTPPRTTLLQHQPHHNHPASRAPLPGQAEMHQRSTLRAHPGLVVNRVAGEDVLEVYRLTGYYKGSGYDGEGNGYENENGGGNGAGGIYGDERYGGEFGDGMGYENGGEFGDGLGYENGGEFGDARGYKARGYGGGYVDHKEFDDGLGVDNEGDEGYGGNLERTSDFETQNPSTSRPAYSFERREADHKYKNEDEVYQYQDQSQTSSSPIYDDSHDFQKKSRATQNPSANKQYPTYRTCFPSTKSLTNTRHPYQQNHQAGQQSRQQQKPPRPILSIITSPRALANLSSQQRRASFSLSPTPSNYTYKSENGSPESHRNYTPFGWSPRDYEMEDGKDGKLGNDGVDVGYVKVKSEADTPRTRVVARFQGRVIDLEEGREIQRRANGWEGGVRDRTQTQAQKQSRIQGQVRSQFQAPNQSQPEPLKKRKREEPEVQETHNHKRTRTRLRLNTPVSLEHPSQSSNSQPSNQNPHPTHATRAYPQHPQKSQNPEPLLSPFHSPSPYLAPAPITQPITTHQYITAVLFLRLRTTNPEMYPLPDGPKPTEKTRKEELEMYALEMEMLEDAIRIEGAPQEAIDMYYEQFAEME